MMNILDYIKQIKGPIKAPLFLSQDTIRALHDIIRESCQDSKYSANDRKRIIHRDVTEPLP